MMNRYPYNSGHLMIVPKRHCTELEKLKKKEIDEIFYFLQASVKVLKKSLSPQGFNIGMNLGKIAGAGEEHLHFHIVPRWTGDTNFMPILGETKVIPEYLLNTYEKLKAAFSKGMRRKK